MAQKTDYQDGDVIFAEFLNNTNRAVNQLADDVAAIGETGSDRPYDGNGMGYLVLKKDKTFAEQVVNTNTIYEVRYDYDLATANVPIPNNCVLKFIGGSVTNGSLLLNNTTIDGGDDSIGVTLAGSCTNDCIYTSWIKKDSADKSTSIVSSIFNLDTQTELYVDVNITFNANKTNNVKRIIISGEGAINNCCAFNVTGNVSIKGVNINRAIARMLITHTGTTDVISSIIIDNVKFDGNNVCRGVFEAQSTSLSNSYKISVSYCDFARFTHYGIRCAKDNTSEVKFNHLHDFGNNIDKAPVLGINLGDNNNISTNSAVTNNIVENILCSFAAGNDYREAHGILLYGENNNVSYNRVSNMYTIGGDNTGTDTEGLYLKGSYNTISNNTIEYANGADVSGEACDGAITLKGATRSYITHNTIITNKGKALVLDADNCVVSNNTIISKDASNVGLYIYSGAQKVNNLVSNNHMDCIERANGCKTLSIFISNQEKINILNNEISGYPQLFVISNTSAKETNIVGNKIAFDNIDYRTEGMEAPPTGGEEAMPFFQMYIPIGNTSDITVKDNSFTYSGTKMAYYARLNLSPTGAKYKIAIKDNTFEFKDGANISNFFNGVNEVNGNTIIYNGCTVSTLFKDMTNSVVCDNEFDIPSSMAIPIGTGGKNNTQYGNVRKGVLRMGTTAKRPTSNDVLSGFQYFDTTLGKPIWWDGSKWNDSIDSDRPADGGMGYLVLKKYETFVAQVTNPNTIYEVRYDYDLDGGSVNIPQNCVLKFNGGSISNGTIRLGNNIAISGNNTKLTGVSIYVSGLTNIDGVTFDGNSTKAWAILENAYTSIVEIYVSNCEIYDYTRGGIRLFCECRGSIYDNIIHDIGGNSDANKGGIWLGSNDYNSFDFEVAGNTIYNVHSLVTESAETGECHGIITYGERSNIHGNTVKNLVTIDGEPLGYDSEAIYTKAVSSRIYDNYIVNGCGKSGEGNICIKGGGKCEVFNNHIDGKYRGIVSASSDNVIRNNYIKIEKPLDAGGLAGTICFIYGQDVTFDGNVCYSNAEKVDQYGLICLASQETGHTTTIRNNTFFGNEVFINIGGTSKVVISNNDVNITSNISKYDTLKVGAFCYGNNISVPIVFYRNKFTFTKCNADSMFFRMTNSTAGLELTDNEISCTDCSMSYFSHERTALVMKNNRFTLVNNKGTTFRLYRTDKDGLATLDKNTFEMGGLSFVQGTQTSLRENSFGFIEDAYADNPTQGNYIGQSVFNSTFGKPVFWNGSKWIFADGTDADAQQEQSE